jgi:protein dithiol:quinone oxidoreductase
MKLSTRRIVNLAAFGICAGLLAYAYYLQFYQGLEPCPLCILQRFGMIVLGAIFLMAAAHHAATWSARIYAALIGAVALAGAAMAGRHVWLQHLPPDRVPECGPGLAYMLEVFPLNETLAMVFTGSGECAKVDWMLWGLSMPAWVLIWFVLLGAVGVIGNWKLR